MKDCLKKAVKEHWWLLLLLVFTIFGFGYQVVPFFVWLFIPTALLYTRNKPLRKVAITYVVSSIGMSLGYLGGFRTTAEDSRFVLVWATVVASFLENIILLGSLFADRYITKHSNCIYRRVLTFPIVWTSLWFLSGRLGPLGDYPSFSTPLIHWADFSQVASLGGRSVLDFLIALTGTVLLEISSFPLQLLSSADHSSSTFLVVDNEERVTENEESDDRNTIPARKRQCISLLIHPVTIYALIMAFVFTYGGIGVNIRRGSFYQNTYPEYVPKTTPVGCVVGPSDQFLDLKWNHDVWLNKTIDLAEKGAKLIIWSELTTNVQNEEDEKVFLERTKELAIEHNVYIGVTYALIEPVPKNKLVLVTKEGEIGIDYNKAHPVPGVEKQPAGPNVLQYLDTEEFGRIGGGICFDYNFADFIGQASTHKVDLMLQPSWTWGPIGTHHQQGNVLRAVENGFTLLRCVSQGVSGVYEPTLNGLFNQKIASNNVEEYIFYLPFQKRIGTLYSYIGDTFSYLCILASIGLVLITYRDSKKTHQLSI